MVLQLLCFINYYKNFDLIFLLLINFWLFPYHSWLILLIILAFILIQALVNQEKLHSVAFLMKMWQKYGECSFLLLYLLCIYLINKFVIRAPENTNLFNIHFEVDNAIYCMLVKGLIKYSILHTLIIICCCCILLFFLLLLLLLSFNICC